MNKNDILEIKKLLSKPKKIAIVSHRNPDGDAYGSSLALYQYLLKFGHQVNVVSPNEGPDFLNWLPHQNMIHIFENDHSKSTALLLEAQIIFTLDFNALHRVGDLMEKVLKAVKASFIMIDHHKEPDDYAAYTFCDPTISSTSQMMFHFFEELEGLDKIDQDIATCLYTGIITDTGSFKYQTTSSDTHRIAAILLQKKIDHTLIHNRLYDTNSLDRLHLLGFALRNLKMLPHLRAAYITLTQNELNSYNHKKGDTEGFVNYGLSLKGIVFAVIFIEDQKQGIIKMSLRSKGSFSVNKFARIHFNGGGHDNAAGGRSELSMKDTISKFLKILPTYKDELKNSYEE